MATNELIITELVFRNVFTEKDPAEIAALLSCFVFQAKTREDGNQLPENLADGVKAIEQIESELGNIEAKFMVSFDYYLMSFTLLVLSLRLLSCTIA